MENDAWPNMRLELTPEQADVVSAALKSHESALQPIAEDFPHKRSMRRAKQDLQFIAEVNSKMANTF